MPDRTFAFADRIVRLCVVLEEGGRVSRTLANQLLRAGTSVRANVEEGQASESKKDFAHKYSLACKEARETHYRLRLLSASEVLPAARLEPLKNEANELVAILKTIIKKSRKSAFQTSTFPLHIVYSEPAAECVSVERNSFRCLWIG